MRGKLLAGIGVLVVAIVTAFGTGIYDSISGHTDSVAASTAPGPLAVSTHTIPGPASGRLVVAVDEQLDLGGQSLALPKAVLSGAQAVALEQGFDGPGLPTTISFLQDNGGAPIDSLTVKLTFATTSVEAIRITGVQIAPIASMPTMSGTEIRTTSAGTPPTISTHADLDSSGTLLGDDGKPYFTEHDVSISATSTESVVMAFTATHRAYRFALVVSYFTPDGVIHADVIDDHGTVHPSLGSVAVAQAFAVTGEAAKYPVIWQDNYAIGGGYHLVKPIPTG